MARSINDGRRRQGLVLEVDGHRAIVLDSEGSFLQVRIRNASEVNVGDLVPIARARSRQWLTAFLSGFFAQGTIYAAASMIFLAILIGFISFMPSSLHRKDSLTMPRTSQMSSVGIGQVAYPDANGDAGNSGTSSQVKIAPGAPSAISTATSGPSSGVGGSGKEGTIEVAKANSHSVPGNTSTRGSAGDQGNSAKPHNSVHAGGDPKAPGPVYRLSAIKSGQSAVSGDTGAVGTQAGAYENAGSGGSEIQSGPTGEPGEGVGENTGTQAMEIAGASGDSEGGNIMTAASNVNVGDGMSLAARSIDGGNAGGSKAAADMASGQNEGSQRSVSKDAQDSGDSKSGDDKKKKDEKAREDEPESGDKKQD